jgi:acyl carrier protein
MNTESREAVMSEFIRVINPYISSGNGAPIGERSSLLNDLNVNSARLVDIILETEDQFHIQIDDQAADRLRTIGDAVDLILEKRGLLT